MSRSRFSLLTDADLSSVHEASLTILRNTGILLQHPDVVQMLASAGASVESAHPIVHLPETLVLDSVILYGGIPHIMDPRTTLCSFGAPEQGVMAAGMAQLGRYYGFPVYINVGLTDAKALDLQAGMEKGATLAWGALAGAELFGHAGIRGADHGASLLWLCADNEMMAYVKRLARGVEVSPDTLAADVVHAVQPGGNFLAEEHTVKHLRRELWLPGAAWTRQAFGAWETDGGKSMTERLRSEMQCLLKSHRPPPVAPELAQALDQIVARAKNSFD